MAAFSGNNLYALNENIRTLYRRLHRASMKTLTVDDFLNLLVPAEHRAAFKTVGPLINLTAWDRTAHFTWHDGTQLVFSVNASTQLPMPRKILLQPDAPPELVSSITSWLERGGNASREFGRVHAVLAYLNERCSRQELRYFWPSILPLLTVNDGRENLLEIAKQLADVKVPKNPPVLSPEIRTALRKATETVATVGLLQAGSEDILIKADAWCHAADGLRYEEPWGSYTGLS